MCGIFILMTTCLFNRVFDSAGAAILRRTFFCHAALINNKVEGQMLQVENAIKNSALSAS